VLTSVLVFTKTTGYRHASIPDGVAAVRALGEAHRFAVTATEDAGAFTPASLAAHQAVIWLSTSGDVLDPVQRAAFRSYVDAGGGFVGVHAAATTEVSWPWYGGLVGARFARHPDVQPAAIHVEDAATDATAHLPARWEHTDEWYDFDANPRPDVRVLMTVDESTYTGGTMGTDHPITWCHPYAGGRSWYTALCHTPESFSDPRIRRMLLGGIRYAAGTDPLHR